MLVLILSLKLSIVPYAAGPESRGHSRTAYNPREHVCELFDLECMRKIDRNVYM
jgi:hypothetical protein